MTLTGSYVLITHGLTRNSAQEREFLRVTNKKPPVTVPRLIPGMVSRYNIIAAHLAKVFFRLFN